MEKQKEIKRLTPKQMKQLIIVLTVILAVLIGVAVLLGQRSPEAPTIEGFDTSNGMLLSMEEEEEWIVVNTEYGTIRYPFAYEDMIRIKPVKEAAYGAMEFYAQLPSGTYPIYTIWFGKEQGSPLGMIANKDGTYVDAFLEIFEPAKKLKDSDLTSFYAAQETVNDVLGSLTFEE